VRPQARQVHPRLHRSVQHQALPGPQQHQGLRGVG